MTKVCGRLTSAKRIGPLIFSDNSTVRVKRLQSRRRKLKSKSKQIDKLYPEVEKI